MLTFDLTTTDDPFILQLIVSLVLTWANICHNNSRYPMLQNFRLSFKIIKMNITFELTATDASFILVSLYLGDLIYQYQSYYVLTFDLTTTDDPFILQLLVSMVLTLANI